MRKIGVILLVAAVSAFMASCGSYKRLAYLQDMSVDETYIVQERPEARISVGDRLDITVTCKNPALAAPFNPVSGRSNYDSGTESVTYISQPESEKGYLVDKQGDIDFPVLGKINVAGATLPELKNEIERLLKEKPYIQDPLVYVEFMNFHVTMMGQVSPGNYIFKSGNVNILEALAQAGDLGQNAVREEVWVIRTTGGQRKLYTINLKSKSLYDSPVFYLQQNDLIYVKPKNNVIDQTISNRLTAMNTGLSVLSFMANLLLWATVYGVL